MSFVAREFVGRMRVLHAKLEQQDNDCLALVEQAEDLLQRRFNMGKLRLRPEQQADVRRILAGAGGLGQKYNDVRIKQDKKAGCKLILVRLKAIRAKQVDWSVHESGCSITVTSIYAQEEWKGHLRRYVVTRDEGVVVNFSPHAIARWFQRAFDPTEDRLFEAMWECFQERRRLPDDLTDYELKVAASGGRWLGDLCHFPMYSTNPPPDDDRRVGCVNVRTFMHSFDDPE